MNNRIKKKWSAMLIAILVIVFITSLMIYFMEKIVPISKNIKWVENSTAAYYEAQSWVEEALLYMSRDNPVAETWATFNLSKPIWYSISMSASWTLTPQDWYWNSEYDSNFNRIWPWEPIQIPIRDNILSSWNIHILLRAPNLDWTCSTSDYTTIMWWTWMIINWILTWSWNTLYSSWWITANMINDVKKSNLNSNECDKQFWIDFYLTNPWTLPNNWILIDNWNDLNWSGWILIDFYNSSGPFVWKWLWTNWSVCSWYKCSIKFSIVTPLKNNNTWQSIPYLEYKAWIWNSTPLQYAIIETDWFSRWFKRHTKKEVRQLTTNEALDFTVFQ